jgi:hypothetical protein
MAAGCRRRPNRQETVMRKSGWLVSATMVVVILSGITKADAPLDPAVEARIKALEQRVAQLENRLTALTNAQKEAALAASQGGAGGAPAAAPAEHAVRTTPSVPSSVSLTRWRDPAAWALLKIGMSWSQVTAILGAPGDKTTGVFGDVWFYPDSSGGRVVFDRDSRVSSWSQPGHD